MIDREEIFSRYPWLKPNDNPESVIMGDDLDSAISIVLYLHTHPNAKLIGIYQNYSLIRYSDNFNWRDILNSVWIDLDIYHSDCRSLGHHIVQLRKDDRLPGFSSSCNLNELVGRSFSNFREKYPLGTIHFLMWLYDIEIPNIVNADLLIWLADSSYINGQSEYWKFGSKRKGFRWNVRNWMNNEIPLDSNLSIFDEIDTIEFEKRMQHFQQNIMEPRGFIQGKGQAASHHLELYGYQCQPSMEIKSHIKLLLEFVSEITGWVYSSSQVSDLKIFNQIMQGNRRRIDISEIRRVGLDNFINEQNIFSFVFQDSKTMNYTRNIGLHGE